MRPPVREWFEGEHFQRSEIPAGDHAFLRRLEGPALLHLRGRDRSRVRILSTLLHGNEPSGLRAMIRFLRSDVVPATDTVFFVASVATALAEPLFTHRSLPGDVDANRCWTTPSRSPQGEAARRVLERLAAMEPECLVDVHNNTGHNPAYGVTFRVGPRELALVSIFADRLVHTPLELGTLVEATERRFPSVTVECGRAGDPVADEAAWRGVLAYLDRDRIDFRRPDGSLTLLDSPVRVRALPEVDLAFGEAADGKGSLTISRDIDRHNFETMEPGFPVGWWSPTDARWPIEAVGADGLDRSRALFEMENGILKTREAFVPVMMTTNRLIAKSDCLFYAVQTVGEVAVTESGEIAVIANPEEGGTS